MCMYVCTCVYVLCGTDIPALHARIHTCAAEQRASEPERSRESSEGGKKETKRGRSGFFISSVLNFSFGLFFFFSFLSCASLSTFVTACCVSNFPRAGGREGGRGGRGRGGRGGEGCGQGRAEQSRAESFWVGENEKEVGGWVLC